MKERWLNSPAVRRFELGQIVSDDFAAQFLEEWDLAVSAKNFLEEFMSWPKGFFVGAEALLARVRSQFHASCLSNSNELHWEKFAELRRHFNSSYSSHLLGKIKPDPNAFITVIQRLSVEPGQVYFFDDSLPNVIAAQEIGMRAFHVEGVREVEKVIRRENLLERLL